MGINDLVPEKKDKEKYTDYRDIKDRCIFCGEDNPSVLQEHHVIPERFNGPNRSHNRITLCANCHALIERIYNTDFYSAIARELDICKDCDHAVLNFREHMLRYHGMSFSEYVDKYKERMEEYGTE